MNYRQMFQDLLKEIGPGLMPNTAYDTAWLARLGQLDWDLSTQALDWISENQLPDGSWGASEINYYHDRVICTLAAMTALSRQGRRAHDRRQIERGQYALERLVAGATGGLMADPNGATVGFEMIAPTLSIEAEALGLIQNQSERILGRLSRQRKQKLTRLEGRKIDRTITIAFSAEMAGTDNHSLLEINNLLEPNGSVAGSPSATAYFITQFSESHPELSKRALQYLRKNTTHGGVPNVAPFDVFERAWILWNLGITNSADQETLKLCQPHLDFLKTDWMPGKGVAFAAELPLEDGDDTSVAYEALHQFGYQMDVEAILNYEDQNNFLCCPLEANPSISTNVHVISALHQAGYEVTHPSLQKVFNFLQQMKGSEPFWFDKWHISPYYPTAHAVIACAGYANEFVQDSVEWIIEMQKPNGSWGHHISTGTTEETAYCLQALALWRQNGNPVPAETLKRGSDWLSDHINLSKPPLWIGKCLYCPELVIRSAILSALILTA